MPTLRAEIVIPFQFAARAAVRLTFLLNIQYRAAQFLIGFQAAFRKQQLIIFINMISTALE